MTRSSANPTFPWQVINFYIFGYLGSGGRGFSDAEVLAEAGGEAAAAGNLAIERFFAGADLLIHDSQYTEQEYEGRKNWGHSTFEHAIAAANRAGVRKLALFHHDPDRTDSQIDEMAEVYCRPGIYGDTEIFFAREGMEILI